MQLPSSHFDSDFMIEKKPSSKLVKKTVPGSDSEQTLENQPSSNFLMRIGSGSSYLSLLEKRPDCLTRTRIQAKLDLG